MSEILAPAILTPLEPIRVLGLFHVPAGWRGAVLAPLRERWPPLRTADAGSARAGGSGAAPEPVPAGGAGASAGGPGERPGAGDAEAGTLLRPDQLPAQSAGEAPAASAESSAGEPEAATGSVVTASPEPPAGEPRAGEKPAPRDDGNTLPSGSVDPEDAAESRPDVTGAGFPAPNLAVVDERGPGLHLFVRSGGRSFRCYRVAVWQPVFVPAGDPTTPQGHLEVWLRLDDLAVALALPDPVSALVERVAARLGAVPTETLAAARDPSALATIVGQPAALAEGLGLEVRLVAFHQATAEASIGPQAVPASEPSVADGGPARTAAGDGEALSAAARLERERAILLERGYPPLARLDRLADGSEVLRLDLASQPNFSVFFVVPPAYPAEPAYLVTASHIGADEAARREAPRGVSLAALADAAVERGVLGRLKQRLGGRE